MSLSDVQRNMQTMEERFSQLETTILKDGGNRSNPLRPKNKVDVLQLKQQSQQQASQITQQQLVQQEHTSQLEEHASQLKEHTSQLEQLQEELTAHFQQQLEEHKR